MDLLYILVVEVRQTDHPICEPRDQPFRLPDWFDLYAFLAGIEHSRTNPFKGLGTQILH
jgi:hypothetical protein